MNYGKTVKTRLMMIGDKKYVKNRHYRLCKNDV